MGGLWILQNYVSVETKWFGFRQNGLFISLLLSRFGLVLRVSKDLLKKGIFVKGRRLFLWFRRNILWRLNYEIIVVFFNVVVVIEESDTVGFRCGSNILNRLELFKRIVELLYLSIFGFLMSKSLCFQLAPHVILTSTYIINPKYYQKGYSFSHDLITVIASGVVDWKDGFIINKIRSRMIEYSAISSRSIYDKFCKLQRATSDYRFRAKSLRVKTITNELEDHLVNERGLPAIYPSKSTAKINTFQNNEKGQTSELFGKSVVKKRVHSYKIIEKNYEQELNTYGIHTLFLKQVFEKKCQQTDSTYNQLKYQVFVKNLCLRLCSSKSLEINQMGLGRQSLECFFEWYTNWQGHITDVNLTYADDLLQEAKMKVIRSLLIENEKLLKLSLCNSSLNAEEISDVFRIINQRRRLFCLDIGNVNSQCLNRLGLDFKMIQEFFGKNQSVAIAKLNNIQLRRQGFEALCRGVITTKVSSLKIVSLQSNNISGGKVCQPFYNLIRAGITHLNLSFNPLGEDFFKSLPVLKSITLKELSLIETGMNSENLYELLQKIEESKTLTVLKVDQNDFSHHWFGKLGERLEVNSSLVYLSLNNCKISTFLPLFQGLTHNKVLKRLDLNKNCLDCTQDISKAIVDCFTFNKQLEELRIRFCNISEQTLVKIFEGVRHSKKLKILDISENMLQDLAATNLIKMLEENTFIRSVGIEKLQISQQMKKRILMKLEQNSAIRDREQQVKLKDQTKQIKGRDCYTWDDLRRYEEQQKKLFEKTRKLQEKNQQLEEKLTKKKGNLADLLYSIKDQTQEIEKKVQDKLRIGNQMVRYRQRQLEKMEEKQQQLAQQQTQQLQTIQNLQARIKQVNKRNKQMENHLEDKLRNHRYLQRKKSKQQQLIFHSPRKSSNCATHLPQK